jgi:hypothetical protein
LRALFVLVFLASVPSAYLAWRIHDQNQYNGAIQRIIEHGGAIKRTESSCPWWWLGDENFFSTVVAIDFNSGFATDADLASLDGISGLLAVDVRSPHVTDEGLKHIGAHQSLEVLLLNCSKVTDYGIRQLGSLPNLEVLSVSWAWGVTSGSIATLASSKKLEILGLAATSVDDVAVKMIAVTWPKLLQLDLLGTNVSDKSRESLRRLTTLEQLDLRETSMTKGAIEELAEQLPDTVIRF